MPNSRAALTETLEQLAAASPCRSCRKSAGINDIPMNDDREPPNLDRARQIVSEIFDVNNIDGYDGSESKARTAYFNAALEMYSVMAEHEPSKENTSANTEQLSSRIGHSLFEEFKDFCNTSLRGNEGVTFTTEQRSNPHFCSSRN